MSDSITKGIHALNINPAQKKEIRQYADLVIYRFQPILKGGVDSEEEEFYQDSLDSVDFTSYQDALPQNNANSVDSPSNQSNISQVDSPSNQESSLFQGELKPKKEAVDQLKSTFFPRLRRLITKLHLCSDPARLSNDPALYLQRILDFQPKFSYTIYHIKRALHILCPDKTIYLPKNDQPFQELKSFRICQFELYLSCVLWNESHEFIQASCASIERLGLSRVYSLARYGSIPTTWTPEDTSEVLGTIDSAIGCFTRSECELVLWDWSDEKIRGINKSMKNCHGLHQNEPVIQIAKSLLPIMKLSRLLLSKLPPCCEERLPHFTEMRTEQLESLEELPRKVVSCFGDFVKDLITASMQREGHHIHDFDEKARSLKSLFDSSSLIISLHIIPLISDADSFPGQNSFKT
ncbi:hypothetical protein PCANC_14833 [Puccinia coronata f. sp. avenae]|uniref:Uncharacterized protein n=1 Tax=Puccinia coronata f. sp. avenae TaxID=200324 RepID=A0A2N5UI56_9BASI|nr:hypothetical protein PCANC_14833 [Puccinia coronata f. sp. avenae]